MKHKSSAGSRRENRRGATGIRAVAERAGVAVSSVSRVFSDSAFVSHEMRERVMRAARTVGYRPDNIARSLRRGLTASVGCVVADIANPTFAEIVKGAGQALRSHGYVMLIVSASESDSSDASQLDVLCDRRVDGLLISVVNDTDRGTREALADVQQPCVILDRDIPGLERFGRVLFDHRAGITAAVGALAALGHRRLGLIGGSTSARPTRERAAGFELACAQLSIQGVARNGTHSDSYGEAATHALLTSEPGITGLIAGSNQILVGMLRALHSTGRTIPEDMSVVACDEVPLMTALQPRLAVVTRDLRLLGQESAEMLVSMINGGAARSKTLPVEFRFGPSCAPPRR